MKGLPENALDFVRKVLNLDEKVPLALEGIRPGGSDRTFFRCRTGDRTIVLMHYGLQRQENALYVDIGRFLKGIGIPVPEILDHDPEGRFVLMEDLGEKDLWSLRDAPWNIRAALYRMTLDTAARLHAFPIIDFPSQVVRLMPAFCPELYRWERDYFREHFVQGVCSLSLEPVFASRLETELQALAERIMQMPPCLIHRDLQSQNVMVRGGATVWIDFQGLRPGCSLYDVASLLYDPYVSFSQEQRLQLLKHYAETTSQGLEWTEMVTPFREAAVQRLLQALGAFGFLGLRQGRRVFLFHIPRALDHLSETASSNDDLSCLRELIERCLGALAASPLILPPKSA
ncbi:MAG: phosphotransferase [Deltaproteobacteria bacterium]|nr:phosphotransferase [Deltaproteobacteria bacterium]